MHTTTQHQTHLSDLHNDHLLWLNMMAFQNEELAILERRLEEIARRNTGTEVLAELESFQNRFIRQRELMDEMRHALALHEAALAEEARIHPIAVQHRLFNDHVVQREAMSIHETLYRDLRSELMRWLAKRM